MKSFRFLAVSMVSGAAICAAAPAMAASDVSNSGAIATQVVTAVVAPVASAQTASLISGAIGGAIGGATASLGGGFSGGGFGGGAPAPTPSGGGGGGFSPSGGAVPGPTSQLLNTRQMGKAGAAGAPKLGAWAQGTYVNVDKSEEALQMTGDVYNVVGGIDYKFNPRGVVGLAVGYENMQVKTKFNNGTFDGNGITVSPYVGYSLTPNWSVDASVGHAWLNYDTSRTSDSIHGSYEASRWFASTNLTGNFAVNRWMLSPKVGVMYLSETSDGYTETGASTAAIDEATSKFGRASTSFKFGYAFANFMPYGKLGGEWDFKQSDAVLKSNGQMSNVDDFGLTYALGVDLFKGPLSGSVEAAYNSGLRSDLDIWQGTARIRYEF